MATLGSEGPGGAAAEEPAYKRVEREHRRIVALLTELAETSEPGRVVEIADALGAILPDHFAHEEDEGGFLDEIALRRPDLDPQLRTLRGQHRELVQVLDEVRREARAEPVDALRLERRKRELGSKLQEHERIEAGLIVDFYYTEEGGLG